MSVPSKILDQAYAPYEEWDPNQRIDRVGRLKQEFPSLTDAEISSVVEEMKRVSAPPSGKLPRWAERRKCRGAKL